MKNFIWGAAVALVVVVAAFGIYKLLPGFSGGGGPVSPEMLKPGVSDYGTLQVTILGKGQPLSEVEVDLGTVGNNGPEGPMSFAKTGKDGIAAFEKVPVGTYNVFFNSYSFPQQFEMPDTPPTAVVITKGQTTKETIELIPKQ